MPEDDRPGDSQNSPTVEPSDLSIRSGDGRVAGRLVAALAEGLGLTLVANPFYLPLSGPDTMWGHLALASLGGVVVLAGVIAHRGDTPWLALPFPVAGVALLVTTPGLGLGSLSVTTWANVAAVATIASLPLVWHLRVTARRRHRDRRRV